MRKFLTAFVVSMGMVLAGTVCGVADDGAAGDEAAPAKKAEKAKPEGKKADKAKKAQDEAAPAEAKPAPAADSDLKVVEPGKAEQAKPAADAKAAIPAADAKDAKDAPAQQQAEPAKEKKKFCVCKYAALYIPNLFKNLSEVFSLQLGAGPEGAMRLTMTRWAQLGFDYGESYFLMSGYEGQYGGGDSYGWDVSAACLYGEKRKVDQTFGSVKPYLITDRTQLIPSRDEPVYKDRIRDFWGIGVKTAWFIGMDLEMHPDEFADFITGIFCYDLKGDNW